MAKPNYSFEKRQRELAKKKKQEQKDAKKREARAAAAVDAPDQQDAPVPAAPQDTPVAGPKVHRRVAPGS
jgi:hypothetical protein